MRTWRSILQHGSTASSMPTSCTPSSTTSTAQMLGDEDERQPRRVLYLGPDRAANLLEVVVLEHDDGTESAIHAMVMREAFERLLSGQEVDRE